MDAREWYEACARGDREAWERLHGFLLGVARKARFDLNDADREDAVQTAISEAIASHSASAKAPEAWIPNTVLRLKNRLIDLYRHRNLSPEVLLDDPDAIEPVTAVSRDNPERNAALREVLLLVFTAARNHIEQTCAQALDLYFRMKAGLDPGLGEMEHIAQRLGITANNASVRIHRCLKSLMAVPRVAEALEGIAGE